MEGSHYGVLGGERRKVIATNKRATKDNTQSKKKKRRPILGAACLALALCLLVTDSMALWHSPRTNRISCTWKPLPLQPIQNSSLTLLSCHDEQTSFCAFVCLLAAQANDPRRHRQHTEKKGEIYFLGDVLVDVGRQITGWRLDVESVVESVRGVGRSPCAWYGCCLLRGEPVETLVTATKACILIQCLRLGTRSASHRCHRHQLSLSLSRHRPLPCHHLCAPASGPPSPGARRAPTVSAVTVRSW